MNVFTTPSGLAGEKRIPLWITLIYLVINAVWFAFADRLVEVLGFDAPTAAVIGIVQTWVFIGVTALLLYWLIHRYTRALRESELRYRGLFEHMLEGFAYCQMIFENGEAQDFIYLAVNDKFETLTGLKGVRGKRVTAVIPGIRQSDAALFDIYARVSLTGQPEKFEMFVEALKLWFSISVYSPKREFFVAVFDVITERKQAEQQIQALAKFPAENPNPVLRLRQDGVILYANDASRPILQEWGCAVGGDAPPLWCDHVAAAFATCSDKNVEVEHAGRKWSLFVTPIIEAGYANLYGRDITEQRRMEDEIRQLSMDLEQRVIERTAQLAAANRELEAFSYSVSHDLRTPLRAIDGFSRILLEDHAAQLDVDAQRYLNIVRSSSQQMGKLIDDLLTFSRLSRQALNKQRVDVVDLVQQVVRELEPERADRQVEIVLGELPACEADRSLLKQVYVNLLSNAIKFTRKRASARIEVGCYLQGNEPVYFVKDNGVGFEMQYMGKLFGVFQRLHRADEYEGTGVGLANVQRIINRHGGRVWAESQVDQGAAFYFTL